MSRLEQLLKLLKADPGDAEVHYMIAMEHKSAGDHPQALARFDECLGLNPDYIAAYFQKANTLLAAGEVEHARTILNSGIDRARQVGDTYAADEMQNLLSEL